ncbi:hypothetical protein [Lautropia mirabilis]|jgi:hypothetical protein|uniref:hypothetical protein n=1 Tax=Lautropia mirabilis TaxID=47671 RepID=UPI0028D252E2|nr:hypothetical protein [Lautropia mirabilis]
MAKKNQKYPNRNNQFNTWNNDSQDQDSNDNQAYPNQGFDNGYGNGGFNQAAYGNAFNPQGFNGQGFNGQGFNGQGFNAQGFNGQGFNGFPQNAGTPNANFNGAFPSATQANGHSAWQSLGLSGLFGGNRQTEQFILGLLLGGAAAYVLGDPEKRAKLIRMGMKLYAGVAGSVEEFKEQIADLKAEVAAEQENAED